MRKLKKKQNAGESSAVPFDEIMSRVDDFYKRYVTSDNYKRLIEEGNYPIDPKRGLYRQYIMDEREGFSRGPGLQVDMGPYGTAAAFPGHSMVDRTDKGFFDSMFDPGVSLLSFLSDYEPSDRSIRFDPTTAGAENNPTLQEQILAHEYGHMLNIQDMSIDDFYGYADDQHGMYMPKSIQNELASRSKIGTKEYVKQLDEAVEKKWQEQINPNREGYDSFVAVLEDKGYDSLEDAKEDWKKDIKKNIVGHDRSPHERRSDVMALRYLADKFNIYKAEDTRPFTIDDLNKLLEQEGVVNKKSKDEKGFSVADRMLQLFNKEDIVWQMNNVAFDPEIADDLPEGSMRAQDGREIPSIPNLPQEMLDKIQQLQSQQPKQGVIKPTLPFNPNTQFISAAQPGVIPGTEYANKVEQGYSELMGIAAPIPVLEAIKLGKFARVPGIIDDLVVDPVLQYVSQFKAPLKAASKLFKKGDFVSEIDWGKWNAEIPNNKPLMEEYATIEKVGKEKGTWMKNPDGSDFTGTPEQWVQQRSSNYLKAFGDSKLINTDGSPMIVYHGSGKKFDAFDPKRFGEGDAGYSGLGIYTTPSKSTADSYSLSASAKPGDVAESSIYALYGNATNPISSSQLIDNVGGDIYPIGKTFTDADKIDKSLPLDLFNFNRTDNFPIHFDSAIKDQQRGIMNKRTMQDAWEIVFRDPKQLKSAVGNNGMFDMSNPNIYKAYGGSLPTFQGTDGSNEVTTENVTADNLKQTIESGSFDVSQEQKELEAHYRSAPERERLRKEHLNATGETLTDTQLDDIINKNVELIYSTGSKVKGSTQQAPDFTYDPNVAGLLVVAGEEEGTFPLQLNDPKKETGVYLNVNMPKDPLGLTYDSYGLPKKGEETLLKSTITHELDHLSNNLGIMGSGKYSPNYQQFKDYYNTFFTNASKENPYSPDYEGDKDMTEYYTMPQEVKSYKRNLETALQDAGIWNPDEGEFTQEHLDLLNDTGFEMPSAPLLEAINPSIDAPKKDNNPYTFGDTDVSYIDRINELLVGTNPEQQAIDRWSSRPNWNAATEKKLKEWFGNEPTINTDQEISRMLFGRKGNIDINPLDAFDKLGNSTRYDAHLYEDWLAERGITKRSKEELAELERNEPGEYHAAYSDEMVDKFVNEVFPTMDRNGYVQYEEEKKKWRDSAPAGFGFKDDNVFSRFFQNIGSKTAKEKNDLLKRFNKEYETDYKTFNELEEKEGYRVFSKNQSPSDERNPGLITEIKNTWYNSTKPSFSGMNTNRDDVIDAQDQTNIARLIPGSVDFRTSMDMFSNYSDFYSGDNVISKDGESLNYLKEQGFNLDPVQLRTDAFNNLPDYQREALEWFANLDENGSVKTRTLNNATIRNIKYKDNYEDLGDDAAPDHVISSIGHAITNIQRYIQNEIRSQKTLFERNNRIEQNKIDQKFNIETEKYKEQQKNINNNVIKFMNEVAMDEQEQSLTLAKNGGAIEQEVIYKNGKPEFKIIFANGAELKINKEEYDKEINPFYKVSNRKASKGLEFGSPLVIRGKLKLLKK